jgi:hypothetical protein
MTQPPDAPERHYALERLREGRLTIERSAKALLVCRARIEKYRQTELPWAQEAMRSSSIPGQNRIRPGRRRLALLEAREDGSPPLQASCKRGCRLQPHVLGIQTCI